MDTEITASCSVTKLPPEMLGVVWDLADLGNKFEVEATLEKRWSCERHEPADLVTVNLGAYILRAFTHDILKPIDDSDAIKTHVSLTAS